MKKLLLILLCFPLLVFSQDEKRLALVIGNANYDKGELKNPVNDALRIAETLKKLEFDVILGTNIATKSDFTDVVMEFGDRRENYDVAIIYYAGHGVQVNGVNYLLPTKVDFQKETDVRMRAFSVQDIMMYLTGITNQVNILILDACRDNPFEGNWNKIRSLKGGGLAKIPPPTGSLIAFSTDVGKTAADGDGQNSVYCESLCKNIMLENTSLDQVFRNVRTDVLKATDDYQSPVENSKLTGSAFYLVRSDYLKEFKQLSVMLENKEDMNSIGHGAAIDLLKKIIINKSSSSIVYFKRASVYFELQQYDKAKTDLIKFLELEPKNPNAYFRLGDTYYRLGQLEEAVQNFSESIRLESDSIQLAANYSFRAFIYNELGQKTNSINDCKKSYKMNPYDSQNLITLSIHYMQKNILDSAYYYCDIGINQDLSKGKSLFLSVKGMIYFKDTQFKKAINNLTKAIEINDFPTHLVNLYSMRTKMYIDLDQYDKAKNDCNSAIEINPINTSAYYNLAIIYKIEEKYTKSILKLEKVIQCILNGSELPNKFWYVDNNKTNNLSEIYIEFGDLWQLDNDLEEMCTQYNKACDLGDCEMFEKHCK